jgi:hypothetical protein
MAAPDPTTPGRSNRGLNLNREVIQLTKTGVSISADVSLLATEFNERFSVRLPALLHPELVEFLESRMAHGEWVPRDHGRIGRELCLNDPISLHALQFAVSTPDFLRVIEGISGCGQISRFDGRIYRMTPGTDHFDSWHDDDMYERMIGMSINLSSTNYLGGVFQLRRKGLQQILRELPNTIVGDAILFRISSSLQHRVTPVEGRHPKTAFAGWFKSSGRGLFATLRSSQGI